MLCNIYKVTLVLLLCCVISEISCNTLSESRNAELEAEVSDLKLNIEKMEKDIHSINEAVTKLVFTLLEGNPQTQDQTHDIKKREIVISSNSLPNLPLSDLAGLRGPPGKDGQPGASGIAGRDGKDGRDGIAGPPGTPGQAGGTVYTRWGRTTCGNDSTLLYSGYAGGSSWNEQGGGVNYQCMPWDPQYNSFHTGSGTWWGSYMAGVEYESYYSNGVFPKAVHDQNAPCTRCYTNNRSALMMISAKRHCSDGWTKEYEGYLMSSRFNQSHQTTFECVDASPEYIDDEGANNDGGLFYFIRTQCNRGGHCPPYDGKKEITCVVCSK